MTTDTIDEIIGLLYPEAPNIFRGASTGVIIIIIIIILNNEGIFIALLHEVSQRFTTN